jgi:tetratricopeptide (TPR) repeat protein
MRKAGWIAVAMVLLPSLLFAQAEGRVRGEVKDTKGEPVAGAKVVITCPAIDTYHKETTTDKRGVFTVLIVDATKQYRFHVEAPGYQIKEAVYKPKIGGETLEITFKLLSLQQAKDEAEKQAMQQPGYKEMNAGRDFLDEGKTAQARAQFAAAVAAKADLYVAWQQLALIDLGEGKPALALTEAEKCLAGSSGYAPCLALAANAAQAAGDTTAYEKYISQYKAANPTDPALLFNDVVPLLNQGKFDEAEPKLEAILAIDPDFADALYQLGIIKVNKADYPKAKELLEHFLKVAPNHKDAGTAKGMLDWLKTQVK